MTLSAFHTHCSFCDGKNTPEEMVLEAINKGCDEIGFSSHSYMAHDERWGMPRSVEQEYKKEILRLKDRYSDKIKIFLGIEYDWYSDFDTSDYDYIIGSIHYILKNGYYIPLDETAKHHTDAIKEFYGSNPDKLAEEYYEMLSGVYERTGCDIVGHFDIITKFDEKELIYEETDSYKESALMACRVLAKKPVVVEINTGAISRGYRTTPYPAPFILDELIRLKAPLVVTSDTHSRETLLSGMDEVYTSLKERGSAPLTSIEEVVKISRKK